MTMKDIEITYLETLKGYFGKRNNLTRVIFKS